MARYASHHRHPVNRRIHMVGIPAIVLSLVVLLCLIPVPAAVADQVGAWPVWTVAALAAVGAWYLMLDLRVGLTTLALLGLAVAGAWWLIGSYDDGAVLAAALTVHAASWVAQFLGHGIWEKNRPALFENITQSLIAPLFLVAEAAFAFGWRKDLELAVHERAMSNVPAFS